MSVQSSVIPALHCAASGGSPDAIEAVKLLLSVVHGGGIAITSSEAPSTISTSEQNWMASGRNRWKRNSD
ncbi:hypothetical protein L1887_35402 [Cichorium endivia]|nr:hypothetical protein L1887_35402 [Cichorium endivia]